MIIADTQTNKNPTTRYRKCKALLGYARCMLRAHLAGKNGLHGREEFS